MRGWGFLLVLAFGPAAGAAPGPLPPSEAPGHEIAIYLNEVRREIIPFWLTGLDALPPTLRLDAKHYTTVVSLVLGTDGSLLSVEVAASSGEPALDTVVVAAARRATRLPNLHPDRRRNPPRQAEKLGVTSTAGRVSRVARVDRELSHAGRDEGRVLVRGQVWVGAQVRNILRQVDVFAFPPAPVTVLTPRAERRGGG